MSKSPKSNVVSDNHRGYLILEGEIREVITVVGKRMSSHTVLKVPFEFLKAIKQFRL